MNLRVNDTWKLVISIILFVSISSSFVNVRRLDGFTIAAPLIELGFFKNLVPMLGLIFIFFPLLYNGTKFNVEKKERGLFFSLLVFSMSPFLSSFLGTTTNFDARIFLYPICVLVVFKYAPPNNFVLMNFVHRLLNVYIAINYIVIIFASNWALQKGYTIGWFDAIQVRLYGVSGHPNNLSSLLLLYIFLTLSMSWISSSKKIFFLISASILIILCQSKTILLILFVCLTYFSVLKYQEKVTAKEKSFFKFITIFFTIIFLVLFVSSIGEIDSILKGFLGEARYNRLSTLTGRAIIWQVTIEELIKNPIFGYGPGLYDNPELFQKRLGFTPSHAHNQIFQTLGETGFLGLVLFLVVWFNFGRASFSSRNSNSIVKVLFLAMTIRLITQSVLRSGFDEIFLFQIIFVFILRATLRGEPENKSAKYSQ